jgi:hypothetical protein
MPVTGLLILSFFYANWLQHSRHAYAKAAHPAATIGGCPLFPANNIWNYDISNLPIASNSASYTASIGLSGHLHPDFGAGLYDGGPIGFPYVVVPASPTFP